MYIYERRKKKVGKSWEFNFLYSNLLEFPNGKFRRDRHRADKTHYRQTFPPPDHDARGKNLSFKVSQCRTRSPRFRRSLIFRKCSNRERERVLRERSRDVNVFREDVPWPRAAPNNKALKRLATTTPTRSYQISGKERNSSLDESSNPCDYPFFPQENVFRQPSTPKNSARFKRTFACMEIACVFS